MCGLNHADFLLKSLKEGFKYDNTMKKLLKKALCETPWEIRMSSEAYLFDLEDAKELLEAYLNAKGHHFSLSVNGEYILIENKKYYDLLKFYVEHRELDEDTQIAACSFGTTDSQEIIKLHHQKHGLCAKALAAAKARHWI